LESQANKKRREIFQGYGCLASRFFSHQKFLLCKVTTAPWRWCVVSWGAPTRKKCSRVLYALHFTRRIAARGSVRVKNRRFFGEDHLSGEGVQVWMYDEVGIAPRYPTATKSGSVGDFMDLGA
jgi:hypothetical protein